MIIFLIGFMGSGKTTLGKRLARRINYEFQDMDDQIEKQEGISVTGIFEQKGEPFFRKLETDFLKSLDPEKDMVVATGGGSPCFGNNMEIMNEKGMTVYLKLNPASLAGRLEKARTIRPLIASLASHQMKEYIDKKLSEREPHYLKAKCIIKGENVKPDHVLTLVFGEDSPMLKRGEDDDED